ncbi:MmgE/PrpD family protein [Pseudotabrizicola alkalilacus]|uniref:MmgE/PrpD family protein n=1 Tax=Pseudotabrizicola alkalilacus TaxID=2305252 RepID=A0A411YWZ3_9RHOB|nr:MmgE/PrpD family protein [Pseudotabrizicola alkalilacus]RGP35391.1 MmgE/PrpD family protein [Pseudotabrizicola alkalilacus]
MSSFTLSLAGLAAGLSFRDLSPVAIGWANRAFADTVGCALAGVGEEVLQKVSSVVPGNLGPAMTFGEARRLHPLDAAQLNGVAAHALDFDDCNMEMDGHPSVSIVPALLALGDQLDSNGEDLLVAYVAGLEAEIRLARVSNPAHADRGWHPTVTFGVIGAAIACGRLLRLDALQMATAIGIAASSAAGLRANSGTMTKPFHAGQANRNGLQAALLAQAGMTANQGVLEHRFGFMACFGGAVPEGPELVLENWAQDFALLSPGLAIKQYPCCAFVHCAIDAAAELHTLVDVAQISEIRVVLHRKRLKNIDRPRPKDGLDAKFSTQYLTARALIDGTVTLEDFSAARVFDPGCAALSQLVQIIPHEAADLSSATVRLCLTDGRMLDASASVAMGRGPANPMTEAQFATKFLDCAAVSLSKDRAKTLLGALLDLPAQRSVRRLTAMMQPIAALEAALTE